MATAKKKPEMKEVAPAETKAVAARPEMSVVESHAVEQAVGQDVVTSDVLIPRLLLMQGISPLVMTRKAQIGDFIRSTTVEKLGDPEHPIEVVPIRMVNSWMNFETKESAGTTSPAFRGQEERNASNENWEWDYEKDGKKMIRRKTITLYALVPSDLQKYNQEIERAIAAGEAPDINSTILPVVITFQSTSFKHAGRKCASFFNNVRKTALDPRLKGRIAPYMYTLPLFGREEKKGTNMWYVFDFGTPKSLKDKAVQEEAARWSQLLNTGRVRVDEAGEVDEDQGGGGDNSAAEVVV